MSHASSSSGHGSGQKRSGSSGGQRDAKNGQHSSSKAKGNASRSGEEQVSHRAGVDCGNNAQATQRKVIGQYMLGKTIGEGTFGKVKIAIHLPTGEKVR